MLIRRISLFEQISPGWRVCWCFYPDGKVPRHGTVALVAPKWLARVIRPIAKWFGYWDSRGDSHQYQDERPFNVR